MGYSQSPRQSDQTDGDEDRPDWRLVKVSFLGQLVGSEAKLVVYTPLSSASTPLFAHRALLPRSVANDQIRVIRPLPGGREPWLRRALTLTGRHLGGLWGSRSLLIT